MGGLLSELLIEGFGSVVDHENHPFADISGAVGEAFEHVGDFNQNQTTFEGGDVVFNHVTDLGVGFVFERVDLGIDV